MDANLHADGNRLTQAQLHQARHPVAHAEADQVEHQRRQADLRGIGDHGVPILGDGQGNDQQQEQARENLHRLVHARSKTGHLTLDQHANGHRPQHNGKHLQHLAELQRQRLIGGHKVIQRQIDDDRHGQDRDHRVHRRQGDIQCHVTVGQVAVEVGTGTARRGCQQHQAYRQRRRQTKALGNKETHHRQQQDLAHQPHQHRLGKLHHAGKVGQAQRQAKAEHDDAQGRGEKNYQQWIGCHCCYSLI